MLSALNTLRNQLTVALAVCLAISGVAAAQEKGVAKEGPNTGFVVVEPKTASLPEPPLVLPAALRSDAVASPPIIEPNFSIFDPNVVPASGCCGMAPRNHDLASYGCSGQQCVPGRTCTPIESNTACGRLFGGLYNGLCCPDPCYEPSWIPAANAAFFQDSPRPVTQTRIRYDAVHHYGFPDSAEFFWGKIGSKGPSNPSPYLNYSSASLYQEIAAKGASAFFETTYLSTDPLNNPGYSGFGDMNVGVKSVVFDRELLLVTTQFRTYIPAGAFTKGLGTGHVSLEPSLLAALKLSPNTFLQMQLADWIPLGGSPGFAGMVFHYHFSLNHNLWRHGDIFNAVATMELNGYTFRGQYTDLTNTAIGLDGGNYLNAGPGLRLQFCDKVDLGFGAAFGFGNGHGPGQAYRTELRIRF